VRRLRADRHHGFGQRRAARGTVLDRARLALCAAAPDLRAALG